MRSQAAAEQPQTTPTAEETTRASVYAMLGSVLAHAPDDAWIQFVLTVDLPDQEDAPLTRCWKSLKTAVDSIDRASVEEEYHNLFIGIGRGELLPYASTYLTGFLQEQPLADLRDDLARLGFERQDNVKEPEDHAAMICEVMAALILDLQSYPFDQQREFFERHVASWMRHFFEDLSLAQTADFFISMKSTCLTIM